MAISIDDVYKLIIASVYHKKTKVFLDMSSRKFRETIRLFFKINSKDPLTALHSLLVAGTNMDIAQEIAVNRVGEDLFYGGLLHDIGKIEMPDDILKGDVLLECTENRERVSQHVQSGIDILLDLSFPPVVVNCAAYHHERVTGSGYPNQARMPNIPMEGLITGISDIFNALIEDRPYRKGLSLSEVVRVIEAGKAGFEEMIWNLVMCRSKQLYENSKQIQYLFDILVQKNISYLNIDKTQRA